LANIIKIVRFDKNSILLRIYYNLRRAFASNINSSCYCRNFK